jgi:hypothetical protein
MKISLSLLAAFILATLAGCAHPPARGGTAGDGALGGTITGQSLAQDNSPQPDYREVLADPGHF